MNINKWKQVKLKEVCDIRRGASPRPIQDYIADSGVPWVKIADATATTSKYIIKTKEFIKFKGISKSVQVSPNTLILSNSATPGLPKFMGIKACVHDGWLIFSRFKDIIPDFLYYQFINIRKSLINQVTGTVFQNLKTDVVKEFIIDLPPILEQKTIANMLSLLDDKIEINEKINQTLEQIAQSIFKHWFIDFEFPNKQGLPYKSSGGEMVESELGKIPKGWKIKSLDEVANFINGLPLQNFRPKSKEYLPVLKIKELKEGISNNTEKADISIDEKFIVNNGDIIFSWSGSLDVKIWCNDKAALNQHLFKVEPNNCPRWFVYFWLLRYLVSFRKIAEEKATTMGHIQRKHLKNSKVIFPDNINLMFFNKTIEPIFKNIIMINIQSQTLSQIRDTLLPKLMTGKIRVNPDK